MPKIKNIMNEEFESNLDDNENPITEQSSTNTLTNAFQELFKSQDDIDVQHQIVQELISDENLEKKTDLKYPIKWSCLSQIKLYLENKNMPKSGALLEQFMNTSFAFLVSKEREGRKEYIQALSALSNLNQNNATKIELNSQNPIK